MLVGIFGKKSDHPLADIKSVQALLETLPKDDAYKSLMELTELMESVSEHTDFKLDHQFALLRLIDETAQPYARKLVRLYFTPFEINKFQENRMWLVLANFFRHTANAYYTVFNRYCNSDKGSNTIKAQVPLLASRAVHAMISKLKYVCAHYGPLDNTIWANLAQIYNHAEQQQYLNVPVSLYSGTIASTSVKCEVGHLLVWYDRGLLALSPLYMHLTERILAQYSPAIDIHPQPNEHSRLSFDLSRPEKPTRINMISAKRPAMRFVSMQTMQAKLEDMMKVLKKNIVPDEINLGGSYEVDTIKNAVQHLLDYLTGPPMRRNARHVANVALNVIYGFDKVVEFSNAELHFNEDDLAHWVTEEISVSGFSIVLPAESDGIGISSLLGIQPEGVSHWGVAVVRRLLRDDANQLHAGAEILANQVAIVYLNQNGNELGEGQPVLWLYAKQDQSSGGAQLLLMKADTFSANRSLKIHLDGKNYLLIPIGLQEKTLDYDLAKFKLIEQEADPEEVN
jgi:hypothetical protein